MKGNKRIVIVGILILLIVGVAFLVKSKSRRSKTEFAATKVETGDIQNTILATGTVQSQNRLEIKPPTSGRVEDTLVVEGAKVRKGQILAWMSSAERVSLLDAARAKGAAELRKWQDLYRATPVISPLNGTLISNNVKPGQTVVTTDVVFVVSDRLIIQATVDETDIAQVKIGQLASVTLDAYPKNKIEAKVDRIAFDAKTVNNVTTYQVDVVAEKVPDFMKSGMTANVSFLIERRENVLTIPAEALRRDEDRTYVMVPGEDGKGRRIQKDVQVGISDGKKVEVVAGLTDTDSVLVPVWTLPGEAAKSSNPFMPQFNNRRGISRGNANGPK